MSLPVFSSEWKLLLACLRTSINCQDTSEIASLVQAPIDWTGFTKLVHRHKVASLIYPALSRGAIYTIPNAILSAFKSRCLTNTCRVLKMVAGLIAITELFNQAGIHGVALKGPLLAKQLYEKLTMRESLDIDLLISPEQVQVAHALLLQAGYHCVIPIKMALSTKQFEFYLKQKKSFVYYSNTSEVQLELHWRLFDDRNLFEFNIETSWPSLGIEYVAGNAIRTLAFEDNLMYLLLHGSHHAWSQLNWLCDIAQLVQHALSLDWAHFALRAQQLKIHRQLAEGILLAHKLLGSPLPSPIKHVVTQNKSIKSLSNLSLGVIRQPEYLSTRARVLMFIRELRLHVAVGSYFKPLKVTVDMVAADWEVIRLPDRLFFLYYPLRPWLWVWRKASNWFNKKSTSASN